MIFNFLWNVRLWLTGVMLIALFPVVLAWKVLVDFPIEWAKEFESDQSN